MSHFSRIRTQITDPDLAIKAIADLGFACETGEELVVNGFGGQKTPVDIRIRLNLSYSIGLRKYGEAYEIVADWFGVRGVKKEEFTQKLNQRYAYHATRSRLEKQGFDLVEEKAEEGGQIRLVLRRMS